MAISIMSFFSCQEEDVQVVQTLETTQEPEDGFTISKETALSNLKSFVAGANMSRSSDSLEIDTIITISIDVP